MPSTITEAEQSRIWRGRRFTDQVPPFPLVPEWLLLHAKASPHANYATFQTRSGAQSTLTFAELDHLSLRLVNWFKRQGLADNAAPLAFAPQNNELSALTIFAVLRSGILALLLNPADPEDRKRQLCAAAGCQVRLAVQQAASPVELQIPDPRLLPDEDLWPLPMLQAETPAFLIGTSGSTAGSKIVAQVQANAAANAAAIIAHHGLAPGVRFMGCLPIHHVNGLHFTLIATLVARCHTILLENFDPFDYYTQLQNHDPHLVSVVPTVLEALLALQRGRTLPQSLRYFVSAAAPLNAGTAERVLANMGRRVCQGYGLTETTNFSCTLPTNLSDDAYRRLMIDAPIPSIGIAVAGNEVAVLQPDGAVSLPGESGEICIRGHNVMAGYWRNPAANAEAFSHGWFHSGDIGHAIVDPECGRTFFVITGRSKNMAKVGGEAVSFEEVERCLCAIPGISDAAVCALTDGFYGQKLIAVIVVDDVLDDSQIRRMLALQLPLIALPSRIVRVDRLPRTQTGKLLRPHIAEIINEL